MRSRRMTVLRVVAATVLLAGCSDDSTPVETSTDSTISAPVATTSAPSTTGATVPEPRAVPLGQAFSIALGESVMVTGEDLTITYDEVVEDSRCPPGVQCIQAGTATIALTLAKTGIAPATRNLTLDISPTSVRYGEYSVKITSLGRGSSPSARLTVT